MGPQEQPSISDCGSVNSARRGRPAVALHVGLDAAARLFTKTDSPQAVTMDAIAQEAGIGKGTLFRGFGSRSGLLNALWARELAELRERVETGDPPLGPAAPPLERGAAFLKELLAFKLKNRHLIRALELGPGILHSHPYKWMKATLEHFITDAVPASTRFSPGYAAYVLLAAMHIDLVEEMMADGLSFEMIQQAQAQHLEALTK